MAGRCARRPRAGGGLQVPKVADPDAQRAIDTLAGAVRDLQARRARDVVTTDLVVGTNRVRHGLGRACAGYHLTPTATGTGFAHLLDKTNPHPELEVWITVVATAQPGATVEVF